MPAPRRGSPYEAILGARIDQLHPSLRAYFSAVPDGMIGVGRGVFDVVGTPRRWLWPVLALLGRDGVIFPRWQRDVAFTVRNHASGEHAVASRRIFHFPGGDRVMVDEIAAENGVLVDRLGRSQRLVAAFDATVDAGALRLASTGVWFVLNRRRARIPQLLAPRVTLWERRDEERDCQRVTLVMEHPLFGRLYEYAGSFTYELRPGEQDS